MGLFGAKKINKEDKKPAGKPVAEKAAVAMQDLYNETAPAAKIGAAKTAVAAASRDAYRILVKPLITEKATNLGAENKYVFVVSRDANKIAVAKAVKAVYGVKPVKVNLINVAGKKVTRGRIHGCRRDWRKAIVTLAKGETIKIYEGV